MAAYDDPYSNGIDQDDANDLALQVWQAYQAQKAEECPICGGDDEKLFPNLDDSAVEDREGYADTFRSLLSYCLNKTQACKSRVQGEITHAVWLESICENIYNNLPKWARW